MQAATKSQLTDSSDLSSGKKQWSMPEIIIIDVRNDGIPAKKIWSKPMLSPVDVNKGGGTVMDGPLDTDS